MSWDIFGYLALQLFLQAVIAGTAFLVCFNVILAIFAWVSVITNSQSKEV
jgi:hypothetical protein